MAGICRVQRVRLHQGWASGDVGMGGPGRAHSQDDRGLRRGMRMPARRRCYCVRLNHVGHPGYVPMCGTLRGDGRPDASLRVVHRDLNVIHPQVR